MSELQADLVLSAIWLGSGLSLFIPGLMLAMRSRHYFKRFLGLGLAFLGLAALAASRGVPAEPVVALFAIIGRVLVLGGLASGLRWFEAGQSLDPDDRGSPGGDVRHGPPGSRTPAVRDAE